MGMGSEEETHEVVKTPLQTPEQVRVRRLGDISNCPVGQNQVEANDGVEAKTVLISLIGVPYRWSVSVQSAGEQLGTNLRRAASRLRRSVTQEIEKTLTEGITTFTHPSSAPTKNDDTVLLKSLIHSLPDQASPDHGSARCRIVRHLRELFGVD